MCPERTVVALGAMLNNRPTKRFKAWMVILLLPAMLFPLLVVGAVISGWLYYSRRETGTTVLQQVAKVATSQIAAGTTASAQAPGTLPKLDLDGAVAALRGDASPELKAHAFAVVEQQAETGNVKAMVVAAACYRASLGTATDDHYRAFEWYRKAAEAGEPVAMLEMSHYYAEGVWVEANAAQAKHWLERAARGGNAEAQWQLSRQGT